MTVYACAACGKRVAVIQHPDQHEPTIVRACGHSTAAVTASVSAVVSGKSKVN